jgi:hypothetical protein
MLLARTRGTSICGRNTTSVAVLVIPIGQLLEKTLPLLCAKNSLAASAQPGGCSRFGDLPKLRVRTTTGVGEVDLRSPPVTVRQVQTHDTQHDCHHNPNPLGHHGDTRIKPILTPPVGRLLANTRCPHSVFPRSRRLTLHTRGSTEHHVKMQADWSAA